MKIENNVTNLHLSIKENEIIHPVGYAFGRLSLKTNCSYDIEFLSKISLSQNDGKMLL